MIRVQNWLVGLLYATFVSMAGSTADANVIGGEASAFGVKIDLSGAGVTLSSGPSPTVSGVAPVPFTGTNTINSLSENQSTFSLSTGIITVNASSNVDGTSGVKQSSADSLVNNLNQALTGVAAITADTVQSTSQVDGNLGSLVGTGTTTLSNAGITIGSLFTPFVDNPTPNLEVINVGGIRVVLNEQIITGNGTTNRQLTVNAIHVFYDVLGVTTGDIIIAQSVSSLQAVPEPASAVLFGTGLAITMTGSWLRRRKKKAASNGTAA